MPGTPADRAPATRAAEAADTLAAFLTTCDLAAAWILLPDGAADRFHTAYQPAPDPATLRRARAGEGRSLSLRVEQQPVRCSEV